MKSNHHRLKFLLMATMLTGLVALLIWSFGAFQVSADPGNLQALQEENSQLRQTLTEMQNREITYRTQIQKANQTIFQLIDQPDPTSPTLSSLQAENTALQERVTLLEQQLKEQQTPTQNSLSRSGEQEESEHEGG